MSTPANPLAKFRTYSYHHILIACDNDAAADWISDPDRSSSVFRQIGEGLGVGAENERPIDLDDKGHPVDKEKLAIGHYVVILNGMIDTRYVIQNAEWFSATAASTDKQDRFNSIAVEGFIEVQEPGGIVFMNALDAASNKLRTDPTGIIWILKTIFVGHGDDPGSGPVREHISNIKPLRFQIYDVVGAFDVSGGTYNISFAGASNGASRLPQYSRAAEQITFTPPDGDNKLETSLNILADKMTEQSKANRKCVVDALNLSYEFPTNDEGETLESMRAVAYKIDLDEVYQNDVYKITGWDCRQTEKGTPASVGAFKFGKSSTVEQAIRHIMERCDRVLKDRTEGADDGVKYIYKIHSKISMIGKDNPDALNVDTTENFDTVLVRYVIRRFAEVTNQTVETVLGLPDNVDFDAEINNPIIRQNLLELDYFFTGKNIDIIDFDMKMEMGLAFMQTLASTNTLTDQAELISKGVPRNIVCMNGQENQKGEIIVRNRTPIFPATKTKDVLLRNAGDPKDTTLFNAYLSRHSAIESLVANVTILGNPYLMSQTNRQVDDSRQQANTQGDNSEAAQQENILLNWDRIPGLVKLNIYMPRTNDVPSSSERLDLIKFWYQGFYYLYGITHKFNEGQFTQELQLLSLPNESQVEDKNEEELVDCGIKPDPATDSENQGTAPADTVPDTAEAREAQAAQTVSDLESCTPTSTEGGA